MELNELQADKAMLMSYINTKLRDEYKSLAALCEDMNIDKDALVAALAEGGFEYSPEFNKFW